MNAVPDDSRTRLSRLTEIGIALSSELNLDVLLEKIVHHSRELTHADAGTLYLLQDGMLHFRIVQNASLGVFEGGTGKYINLPPVPLTKSNVSAYAALTRQTVNIRDVYQSNEFDFTGPRKYDAKTGYHSKSMLVIPMEDHEQQLIGVLQLMNATDPESGEVVYFPDDIVDLVRALASQAAVGIANANLIQDTKDLFESLIQVLAVAVDAKSKYTGNHVQRVAEFTMWLADAVNNAREGELADINFTDKQIEEIRLAGWLHDVGKVTTPVWVMDKATKLETIVDRVEFVRLRFELMKAALSLQAANRKIELLKQGAGETQLAAVFTDLEKELAAIDDDLAFIERCNRPGEFMEDEKLARLKTIAARTFTFGGHEQSCLTDEEVYNLSIRKGSLTSEQMQIMRDHAPIGRRMLEKVPFKNFLKNVPMFAGQHHEKLDGSGYPEGLKGDQIAMQARLIAIADFYEALSAKDRPYKPPMPVEKILAILNSAADHGEIDKRVLDLMIREKVHEKFEQAYEASRRRTAREDLAK